MKLNRDDFTKTMMLRRICKTYGSKCEFRHMRDGYMFSIITDINTIDKPLQNIQTGCHDELDAVKAIYERALRVTEKREAICYPMINPPEKFNQV